MPPLYGTHPPAVDSVERLAQDLRQLRHSRGFPKLTTMQFHTGISKSTISAALKGDRLPSEKTVRSLADFFDADAEVWSRRRGALDRRTPPTRTEPEIDFNPQTGLMETPAESGAESTDTAPSVSAGGTDYKRTAEPPMVRRRVLLLATTATAVATALATSLAWYLFAPRRKQRSSVRGRALCRLLYRGGSALDRVSDRCRRCSIRRQARRYDLHRDHTF
jgi:transcriptional regulator with XRE-family HTH domain